MPRPGRAFRTALAKLPISAARRQGCKLQRADVASLALVIDEEKEFVLDNSAAEGGAELVLPVNRLHAAQRLEKTDRVKFGIAQEFPHAAVEGVGAALHADIYHRT